MIDVCANVWLIEFDWIGRGCRSTSSLSHYSLGGSTYRGKRFSKDFGDINELDAVLNRWKQKQATMLGLNYGSIGTMGIAGVGLDPHELPPIDLTWVAASFYRKNINKYI